MRAARFKEITANYPRIRVALIGDLCLDRYFEIDPDLREISIETHLPVHNVTRVRCQPGGAGTILNNLIALGVGCVYPAAIIGKDGEGYELCKALRGAPAVNLDWLVQTEDRRTFTYSKPLLMHKNRPPEELNRLDIKNWTPTPEPLQDQIAAAVRELAGRVDAIILLDQVDIPETGVITKKVLAAVGEVAAARPELLIFADSRRGLRGFPPVGFKMNAAELSLFFGENGSMPLEVVQERALRLARRNRRHVIVSLSQDGIVGADARAARHVPALPARGEIDIVGAGDAVTANLAAALAAGAELSETLELTQLAASIVVHQLGTTGTASVSQLEELLLKSPFLEN